jgi:hypothetical protein
LICVTNPLILGYDAHKKIHEKGQDFHDAPDFEWGVAKVEPVTPITDSPQPASSRDCDFILDM